MFEMDLYRYFELCHHMKRHGYDLFEVNDLMPWYLDVLTEMVRQQK